MVLRQADPLVAALEEAEVAAGAASPLVVLGDADRFLEDAEDVRAYQAVVDEGVGGFDVRLVADVSAIPSFFRVTD